ncbi:MAG TPA: thrombospondin type 3 repeat-containing protein [Enhygromyxa sp.]|nr:thrombospondin type 3 repeat-containing protein [Enhygromyxa sp.]
MSKARLESANEHRSKRPASPQLTRRRVFKMPRGLGFLLILLVVFSCTSVRFESDPVTPSDAVELGPNELAQAQRDSLRYVFYRGNDLPPRPTAAEQRRLERDLATAPPVEVQELRELYGNDDELLAYATRDSDNDGVLDFRISEYRGKFFEGDIDLDGDGVRNVYDSAPYDPKIGGVDLNGDLIPDKPGSFADRDGDGIPDHLDWSRRKPEPLSELQTALFRDFGVILIERSSRFTPELAQAVDDTLRFVIRERLPTLRTIAVEEQLLIDPDLGDNGFMLGQTQTLTICTKSLEGAEQIVLLGLVIHEVAHAWQLAQDFDESNLAEENVKMHFPPGHFTRSLERYGWKVDRGTLDEGYRHRLYWPHFYATSPRYLYRGSSPHEWAVWFEDVQAESGPEFLRNSPAVTWGMVGPYSLTSPWEWHADHLMAALYNRMDRGISEHDNRTYRNIAGLLRTAMLESVQSQWSRYDYRNAVGTSVDRELGRRFAVTEDEIEILVDRYVIPLADFPMLSEALALESEATRGIGAKIGATWDDLRERMHEPMRHRPDLHALVRVALSPWDLDSYTSEAPVEQAEDDDAGELDATAALDGEVMTGEPEPAVEMVTERERPQLPSHHGAGRVGGYAIEPADEASAAGDEGLEGGGSDDEELLGSGGVGPVGSLFEQLRRAAPMIEEPAADPIEAPEDDGVSPASPE